MSWFSLAGHQVPTKAVLSVPLLKLDKGFKIQLKASGWREGKGEITHK